MYAPTRKQEPKPKGDEGRKRQRETKPPRRRNGHKWPTGKSCEVGAKGGIELPLSKTFPVAHTERRRSCFCTRVSKRGTGGEVVGLHLGLTGDADAGTVTLPRPSTCFRSIEPRLFILEAAFFYSSLHFFLLSSQTRKSQHCAPLTQPWKLAHTKKGTLSHVYQPLTG